MFRKGIFYLCMTIVTLGLGVDAAHAAIIGLNVLDSNIVVGDNFNVEVRVDGQGIGEDLLGFGFDVAVGGTACSYTGYQMGSGFDDISDPFNTNNVTGMVIPGISDDDVLLATLFFSADAAGNGLLSISGPYDGFFYGLFYEESGIGISAETNIVISEMGPSAVPVPAPILLLGTGLIGITWTRRRMR